MVHIQAQGQPGRRARIKRNLAWIPEDFYGDLAKTLAELEEKTEALDMTHDTFSHDTRAQLKKVFDALRELITQPKPPKRTIGFVTPADKGKQTSRARGKT